MTLNIDKYDVISTAMNIFLIYIIPFQQVIMVLAEDSNEPEKIKSFFFEDIQLFDEISKKCDEKFLENLMDEKNYFDTVQIVLKVYHLF